jgi:hypothetical protein
LSIKKKIFVKNRVDSTQFQSTATTKDTQRAALSPSGSSKQDFEEKVQSALTEMLIDEDEDEQDFTLVPPDPYKERHLLVRINFVIWGKKPVSLSNDLSKKNIV